MSPKKILIPLIPILLSGCTSMNSLGDKSVTKERAKIDNQEWQTVPDDNDAKKNKIFEIDYKYNPYITVLPKNDYFINKMTHANMKIKDVKLKPYVKFLDGSLSQTIKSVVEQTNYNYVIDDVLLDRMAKRAFSLKGDLLDVLEQIQIVFDVTIEPSNNILFIKDNAEYLFTLPGLNKKGVSKIVYEIKSLGAKELNYEEQDQTIRYRAKKSETLKIENFLTRFRKKFYIVNYDINLWLVETDYDKPLDWAKFDRLSTNLQANLDWKMMNTEERLSGQKNLESNCSNSSLDPAFIQTYLQSQGIVSSLRKPEITVTSGDPEDFSFSEKTTEGVGKAYNTNIEFKTKYYAYKVSTDIKFETNVITGARRVDFDKSNLTLTEKATSYPGGQTLITGVKAKPDYRGKSYEFVMLLKPRVTLLVNPGKEYLNDAGEIAHKACMLEQREKEKTVSYRSMKRKAANKAK